MSHPGWSPGSSRLREWALLVTYLVMVLSIWWDIRISDQNANRIVDQGAFAAAQRAVVVHNEGVIIHNQMVLCDNIERIAGAAGFPLPTRCIELRTDFQP